MTTNAMGFRNRKTFVALCQIMVLFLAGIAALNGCNRVSDEQLAKAVETAMKRSTLRNKAEILKHLQANAQKLAVQELERLNKAEQVYDTQVFFDMIGKFHPMGYGFWFKIKRGFSAYDILDIRESESLFHKYEVFIEYKGVKIYFCCWGCDDKFLAEPEKYIPKLPAAIQAELRRASASENRDD